MTDSKIAYSKISYCSSLIMLGLLSGCSAKNASNTNAETQVKTPTQETQDKNTVKKAKEQDTAKTTKATATPKAQPTGTDLKPDDVSTANQPPKSEDLARYTADLKGEGVLNATIKTSMGEFHCELFEKEAPITVANFVGLGRGLKAWVDPRTKKAQSGVPLYKNIKFHRVIPRFMIQGGDPTATGTGRPGYVIKDEFAKNRRHNKGGILSMANAGPNTGGSQFFITEIPTPHLDDKHTVFGQCNEVDLVKKIATAGSSATVLEHITFSRASK